MQANMCQHQKTDGTQCQAVAYRNLNYCRHHARYYDQSDLPAAGADFVPPIPDHPDAALLAVHQATRSFLAGKIDAPTCRLLIYAAQIESNILQQRLGHEKLAYQRARELKKEQDGQKHAESRTHAFLEALRKNGYQEAQPPDTKR